MLKTPTQDSAIESAIDLGSALGGGMLSNGLMTLVPESQAKNLIYIKGGAAAAALVGMAATDVKKASWLKSAFLGMAIAQGLGLVQELGKKVVKTEANPEGTDSKFIAGVFGLACPCDAANDTTERQYVQMPALNGSYLDLYKTRAANFGVQQGAEVSAASFN